MTSLLLYSSDIYAIGAYSSTNSILLGFVWLVGWNGMVPLVLYQVAWLCFGE